MIYSKQKLHCNCCGKLLEIEFPRIIGRDFKVCSKECLQEIKWRETLSIMGEKYSLQNKII
jgi:hypothetical protein